MKQARRSCGGLAIGIGLAIGVVVFAYLAVYLWSQRIPDRWQEVTRGMTRGEVAEFIGSAPVIKRDGRDRWTIERPIGEWILLISYNEDDTFRNAHLSFSCPPFGKYHRARNYSEYDDPYEIRA